MKIQIGEDPGNSFEDIKEQEDDKNTVMVKSMMGRGLEFGKIVTIWLKLLIKNHDSSFMFSEF